jgi:quinol monooxygenase YgiN
MALTVGTLLLLEAQPGKGAELGAFLERGREIALAEEGTVTWYAFKLSETGYGVFDTFEGETERDAYLNGEIPRALAWVAEDLLAKEPDVRQVAIIAAK